MLVVAGDESSHEVVVWDVGRGNILQRLSGHTSLVMDTKYILPGGGDTHLFASLSENQLLIHEWDKQ